MNDKRAKALRKLLLVAAGVKGRIPRAPLAECVGRTNPVVRIKRSKRGHGVTLLLPSAHPRAIYQRAKRLVLRRAA